MRNVRVRVAYDGSPFYGWQRQLMENMSSALDGGKSRRQRNGREEKLTRKVEALEAKLTKKDNVIAEVSEEFVRLKKNLGSPDGAVGPFSLA